MEEEGEVPHFLSPDHHCNPTYDLLFRGNFRTIRGNHLNAAPQVILLAEDNPDDAFIFQIMFRRAKLPQTLHIVHDGEQVMDWISGTGQYADRQKFPMPHLLLLDLKMPVKTGFDVLEWLQARTESKELPVAILSSSDDSKDVQRAKQFGVDAYFVKSADLKDVTQYLRARGAA
jgi:CheY-like chemotaxis protein